MTRARRVDSNQAGIVKALRQLGCSVLITSGFGDGFPDLVCGFMGKTIPIEVKRPAGPRGGLKGRKLTPDQAKLHAEWRGGPIVVVRSIEEAMRAVTGEENA